MPNKNSKKNLKFAAACMDIHSLAVSCRRFQQKGGLQQLLLWLRDANRKAQNRLINSCLSALSVMFPDSFDRSTGLFHLMKQELIAARTNADAAVSTSALNLLQRWDMQEEVQDSDDQQGLDLSGSFAGVASGTVALAPGPQLHEFSTAAPSSSSTSKPTVVPAPSQMNQSFAATSLVSASPIITPDSYAASAVAQRAAAPAPSLYMSEQVVICQLCGGRGHVASVCASLVSNLPSYAPVVPTLSFPSDRVTIDGRMFIPAPSAAQVPLQPPSLPAAPQSWLAAPDFLNTASAFLASLQSLATSAAPASSIPAFSPPVSVESDAATASKPTKRSRVSADEARARSPHKRRKRRSSVASSDESSRDTRSSSPHASRHRSRSSRQKRGRRSPSSSRSRSRSRSHSRSSKSQSRDKDPSRSSRTSSSRSSHSKRKKRRHRSRSRSRSQQTSTSGTESSKAASLRRSGSSSSSRSPVHTSSRNKRSDRSDEKSKRKSKDGRSSPRRSHQRSESPGPRRLASRSFSRPRPVDPPPSRSPPSSTNRSIPRETPPSATNFVLDNSDDASLAASHRPSDRDPQAANLSFTNSRYSRSMQDQDSLDEDERARRWNQRKQVNHAISLQNARRPTFSTTANQAVRTISSLLHLQNIFIKSILHSRCQIGAERLAGMMTFSGNKTLGVTWIKSCRRCESRDDLLNACDLARKPTQLAM